MTLDHYITLAELAAKLGLKGKDPVEAARKRLRRREIPTEMILGTRMVLKVSLDEALKRERLRLPATPPPAHDRTPKPRAEGQSYQRAQGRHPRVVCEVDVHSAESTTR